MSVKGLSLDLQNGRKKSYRISKTTVEITKHEKWKNFHVFSIKNKQILSRQSNDQRRILIGYFREDHLHENRHFQV
jgi:hypothetical protein